MKICVIAVLCLAAVVSATDIAEDKTEDVLDIARNEIDIDESGAVETEDTEISENGRCYCRRGGCSCCQRIRIKILRIRANVCLKIYYRKYTSVTIALVYNGRTIFRRTLSVRNPPAVCVGVPGARRFAKLCVKLYGLRIRHRRLRGCVQIYGKLWRRTVARIRLGCFTIPFLEEQNQGIMFDQPEYFLEEMAEVREVIEQQIQEQDTEISENGKCSCKSKGCSCCQHIRMKPIGMNANICVKISYTNSQSITMALVYNGKTLYRKTLSIRNPPAVCVSVPGGKKFAKLCVKLYSLGIQGRSVRGCIKTYGKVLGKTVVTIKIGCFSIPFLEGENQEIMLGSLQDLIENLPELRDAVEKHIQESGDSEQSSLKFEPENNEY